jgi:hypothetical protein
METQECGGFLQYDILVSEMLSCLFCALINKIALTIMKIVHVPMLNSSQRNKERWMLTEQISLHLEVLSKKQKRKFRKKIDMQAEVIESTFTFKVKNDPHLRIY